MIFYDKEILMPLNLLLVLALVTVLVWTLVSRQFGLSGDLFVYTCPHAYLVSFSGSEFSTFYLYRSFFLFSTRRCRR